MLHISPHVVKLERVTRFELATNGLEGRHSTAELHPHIKLVVGLTPLTSFDSIKGKSAELPTVKMASLMRFELMLLD